MAQVKGVRRGNSRSGAIGSAYARYRFNAKHREKAWELTIEQFDFLTSSNCYYCGHPPKAMHRGVAFNGIDRRDNDVGYLYENCVPACGNCNYAKRGNSVQDFFSWIERLMEHHGKRIVSGKSKSAEKRKEEAPKAKRGRPKSGKTRS